VQARTTTVTATGAHPPHPVTRLDPGRARSVLELQRSAGNRTVASLMDPTGRPGPVVQRGFFDALGGLLASSGLQQQAAGLASQGVQTGVQSIASHVGGPLGGILGGAGAGLGGAASSLVSGDVAGALSGLQATGATAAVPFGQAGMGMLGNAIGGQAGSFVGGLGGAVGQGLSSVISGGSVGQAGMGILNTAAPGLLSMAGRFLGGL
jgi:hypothetical protein